MAQVSQSKIKSWLFHKALSSKEADLKRSVSRNIFSLILFSTNMLLTSYIRLLVVNCLTKHFSGNRKSKWSTKYRDWNSILNSIENKQRKLVQQLKKYSYHAKIKKVDLHGGGERKIRPRWRVGCCNVKCPKLLTFIYIILNLMSYF